MHSLVSTQWLNDHLTDPSIRIVDGAGGSVRPRGTAAEGLRLTGNARSDFEAHHIPGAVLLDIDEVSDQDNPLPNMLPAPEQFADAVGRLGIGNQHRVVVYDVMGIRTSPRVWWMFRVFGHDDVAVLDGGLPTWVAKEHPVESGPAVHEPTEFRASLRPGLVRDLGQMVEIQRKRHEQVVDGRPAGRFLGIEPEPRPGLRSGHMPWSVSLPIEQIVDPAAGTVFSLTKLREAFVTAGIDLDRPATATCGWGIAACTLVLGLHLLGKKDAAVYDGAWAEWAARDNAEIVTG